MRINRTLKTKYIAALDKIAVDGKGVTLWLAVSNIDRAGIEITVETLTKGLEEVSLGGKELAEKILDALKAVEDAEGVITEDVDRTVVRPAPERPVIKDPLAETAAERDFHAGNDDDDDGDDEPEPKSAPTKRRWWVWALGIFGALLAIGLAVGGYNAYREVKGIGPAAAAPVATTTEKKDATPAATPVPAVSDDGTCDGAVASKLLTIKRLTADKTKLEGENKKLVEQVAALTAAKSEADKAKEKAEADKAEADKAKVAAAQALEAEKAKAPPPPPVISVEDKCRSAVDRCVADNAGNYTKDECRAVLVEMGKCPAQ